MNRSKKTAANAVSQIVSLIVQSVCSLIVTRAIISDIGSEYNGITATATQLLVFLSLIEGGFTLASLVKLYVPFQKKDYSELNQYLSLTDRIFKKIGLVYLIVGVACALAYTPFVKTEVPFLITASIMVLSVVSSAFSVFYVSKFRLIYQVSQEEYITYNIQTVLYVFMYIFELLLIKTTKDILLARICVTIFQILSGVIIGLYAKHKYPFISYKSNTESVKIEGTKDVFIGKLCGLVFSSAPIFFISSFVGVVYTSVYAVYNYVLNMISNAVNAVLIAPRNALGQMLNSDENNDKRVATIFDEYEFITGFVLAVLLSVTMALIIPFVKIYTSDVNDVDYVDLKLGILLVINVVFYLLHVPSGSCLEVAGKFKDIKKIQSISAASIIIFSIIGALCGGIYGILIAKLATSIILTLFETIYVRKKVLKNNWLFFIKNTMPSLLVGTILSIIETNVILNVDVTIVKFIAFGFALTLLNTTLIIIVNFFINRNSIKSAFLRVKNLIKNS